MSDFEQCLNQLQVDLITLLVNFSYQVGTMMSRYDFLEARRVILRNVRTDYNLKQAFREFLVSPALIRNYKAVISISFI